MTADKTYKNVQTTSLTIELESLDCLTCIREQDARLGNAKHSCYCHPVDHIKACEEELRALYKAFRTSCL
jgi:hypothetical protein